MPTHWWILTCNKKMYFELYCLQEPNNAERNIATLMLWHWCKENVKSGMRNGCEEDCFDTGVYSIIIVCELLWWRIWHCCCDARYQILSISLLFQNHWWCHQPVHCLLQHICSKVDYCNSLLLDLHCYRKRCKLTPKRVDHIQHPRV